MLCCFYLIHTYLFCPFSSSGGPVLGPGAVSHAHTCLHRQRQPVSIYSCHWSLWISFITYNYRYYGEYALFCLVLPCLHAVFRGPCTQGLELLHCCGWTLPPCWCPPCWSVACDVSITTNSWNRWTKRLHSIMLFHYYWITGWNARWREQSLSLSLSLSHTRTHTRVCIYVCVCVCVNTLISRLYKSLIGLSRPVL